MTRLRAFDCVWVDFGQILVSKGVLWNLGSTVLYIEKLYEHWLKTSSLAWLC